MTLAERADAAAAPARGTPSMLEELLGRARWGLTDAAHLDLAAGEQLDGGRVEGALVVVLGGEVQVLLDGTEHRLRSGVVLLRARPAAVRVHALEAARIVVGSLQLGDDLGAALLRMLPEAVVACELISTDAQVGALAAMLAAELVEGRPGSELLSGRIAGLLAAATMRAWVEYGCAPDGWLSARVDPGIARVDDAIRDDPGSPWPLERLAGLAHTSRSAFVERFRAAVGDSPARYLTRVRMERAKSLLTADRVSVTQAAMRSGYGSDAAFSRAFTRHTGMTPSAWRRAGERPKPALAAAAPRVVSARATVASS